MRRLGCVHSILPDGYPGQRTRVSNSPPGRRRVRVRPQVPRAPLLRGLRDVRVHPRTWAAAGGRRADVGAREGDGAREDIVDAGEPESIGRR